MIDDALGPLLTVNVVLALLISGVFLGVLAVTLFLCGRTGSTPDGDPADFAWHVLIPCRDEEAVIGATIDRLRSVLPGVHAWVIDDASTDGTARVVAERAAGDEHVHLVRRRPPHARTGKSDALNAGYREVVRAVEALGDAPERVIVGVFDADGRPAPDMLRPLSGARLFGDPAVGAVQVEVRMVNRDDRRPRPGSGRLRNLYGRTLVRMQDIEFRAPIAGLQRLRRAAGSVALGGNGQFTRLSVLYDLDEGPGPWRGSLLEDYELGLHVLLAGHTTASTRATHVEQEGLFDTRRLLAQRTRWAQGNLMCSAYLARVWRHLRPKAALAITYSLAQPWLYLLGTLLYPVPLALALLRLAEGVDAAGAALLAGALLLATVPLALWGPVYGRTAERGHRVRTLIGWGMAYVLYLFVFYVTAWRAAGRIAAGRSGWAKTRRNAEITAGPAAVEA